MSFVYPYQRFLEREGIPVFEATAGVDDVTELPRKPWPRMGGSGTYIQLESAIQSERGLYVAEVPGGGALNPERHLYNEAILILQGRGLTEIWQEGQQKRIFEWAQGSLFAPPRNTWHRLVNVTQEPVLILGVTSAPRVIDSLDDSDLVFNCPYVFPGLYNAEADYFQPSQDRLPPRGRSATQWYTNFIPDANAAFIDDFGSKVSGGQVTVYEMGGGFPRGHLSEWPVGRYHKAHHHGPGAILIGLKGEGYALLWPEALGINPYRDGHGDEVIKVDWGPRSIYSPPNRYFHQHFNTANQPARHVAIYGDHFAALERSNPLPVGEFMGGLSVREGGTLIEYEDEDPEIRRRFGEILKQKGVAMEMPATLFTGPRK